MFIYREWDKFCQDLRTSKIKSITASTALKNKSDEQFLILKHDVETNLKKALKLAQIESKYSHKGSYYVQAYLLNNKKNINILKKIQELGHEVSYHHDVMDSNNGDLKRAKEEFERNVKLFNKYGFNVETVCQHGNPVIERKGFSSNRDFFRDTSIAESFNDISDIMVNFKSTLNKDYKYISDAGYGWKIIFDPENNDLLDSSEKDISLDNLDKVLKIIKDKSTVIVSTHPHRWNSNIVKAKVKNIIFNSIKYMVKYLLRVPFMNKLLGRFYFLAKKI